MTDGVVVFSASTLLAGACVPRGTGGGRGEPSRPKFLLGGIRRDLPTIFTKRCTLRYTIIRAATPLICYGNPYTRSSHLLKRHSRATARLNMSAKTRVHGEQRGSLSHVCARNQRVHYASGGSDFSGCGIIGTGQHRFVVVEPWHELSVGICEQFVVGDEGGLIDYGL